jgi:hypothetical protein
MLDNLEINEILEKLETLEDEELAVELLKEFNDSSKHLGKLILNLDKSLSHDAWKKECDQARARLDAVVKRINDL